MLASTFGLVDAKHPIYQTICTLFLPASLALLLLSTDIKAIMRLEKSVLIMMAAGSAGIMIGTPMAFFTVKKWVGDNMWSGFGALSASWIGGSANMIAVKEAIGTPDAVFTPMVIVDTIVPYAWMGILIAFAAFQPAFDKRNRSDRAVLDELAEHVASIERAEKASFSGAKLAVIIAIASISAAISLYLAKFMPSMKNVMTSYTWAIILASIIGIALSFTPARRLEGFGASRIGYFMLYFVLTAIGAKASISHMGATAFLIAAGFMIVAIHAIVLIIVGRIIKAPMFLMAVASQANIGGVASAPIVAAVYEPGLASVGLLLALS